MDFDRPGRVVVGVHPTLSGLQALRVAVAEARSRGMGLHAIRVADQQVADHSVAGMPLDAGTARYTGIPRGDGEPTRTEAAELITRAFHDTHGMLPTDLPVHTVVLPDTPGPVLAEYACREGDLLVLGAGRRGRLSRMVGSKVVRYCLARASCPVLVVPPPPLARSGSTRMLMRRLRRDIDRFAGSGL